jgi:hypothetical protein
VSGRIALARQALRAAMQLRRNLALPREAPVNAFDLARMVGADVRFLDTPSLEGMLVRDPGLRVLLPSTKHRPKGRILFSCAHEVGHHQLGHGTKADLYLDGNFAKDGFAEEEYLAESFAGHLLMPRPAVLDAFARRGWQPTAVTPTQAFILASQLGVGYGTLVLHMNTVMDLLSTASRDDLEKVSPKAVKADLFGTSCPRPLVIADRAWRTVPIDAEREDVVILPSRTGDDCSLLTPHGHRGNMSVYIATAVGETTLSFGGGEIVLRVSRQHYIGPLSNRYLPDPDEH